MYKILSNNIQHITQGGGGAGWGRVNAEDFAGLYLGRSLIPCVLEEVPKSVTKLITHRPSRYLIICVLGELPKNLTKLDYYPVINNPINKPDTLKKILNINAVATDEVGQSFVNSVLVSQI